jgi:uncharacterized protein
MRRPSNPNHANPNHANTWPQTATGRAVDLIAPTAASIDLEIDVAEQLARIARFSGACRSGPYSVAQHSVLGADALYRETSSRTMAAAFLLHHAHEFVLGDLTTPAFNALCVFAGVAATTNGIMKDLGAVNARVATQNCVRQGLAALKDGLDAAIYGAAGLDWPLDEKTRDAVKTMDIRVLATERRHLLATPLAEWSAEVERAVPVHLIGKLRVWPWPEAADEFRDRLKRYLPEPHTNWARPRPKPKPPITAKRQLPPA